jgi:hypothetical protein
MLFPSRNNLFFNPGVPDRQVWAIGMVAVQWSMTETIMHHRLNDLTKGKPELIERRSKLPSFKHHRAFWEEQIQLQIDEPQRALLLAAIVRVKELKAQRDRIFHGLWGGGMEGASWAAAGTPTSDGRIFRSPNPNKQFSWDLTYARVREISENLSKLNSDLFALILLPKQSTEGASA